MQLEVCLTHSLLVVVILVEVPLVFVVRIEQSLHLLAIPPLREEVHARKLHDRREHEREATRCGGNSRAQLGLWSQSREGASKSCAKKVKSLWSSLTHENIQCS